MAEPEGTSAREAGPDAPEGIDTPDAPDTPEASGFGGSRSGESSGVAGSRWMRDAEDEDALLPDAGVPTTDTQRGTTAPE